jgi:hypothetical protein
MNAREYATVFAELLDRLAGRLQGVLWAMEEHGRHYGTLPNVEPLAAENFRGVTPQRIARTDTLLANVLFHGRTRFFHKLHSLIDALDGIQKESSAAAEALAQNGMATLERECRALEVLDYDLNTCLRETIIVFLRVAGRRSRSFPREAPHAHAFAQSACQLDVRPQSAENIIKAFRAEPGATGMNHISAALRAD